MASRETELLKDKIEVSLDGRQIFYLFFGGAVIATLVFVLGVMVGRRIEARSVAEVGGNVATDPLAALDKLERGSDLAFPAALRGDDAVALGAVDEALAPATGSPAPVLAAKELGDAPVDKVADAEPVSVESVTPPPKAASEAAPEPKPVAPSEVPKKATESQRFTLQVGSFQQREEAEALVAKLSGAKASASIVQAELPDRGTYFRVRVGGYSSYEAALAGKNAFEGEHHIIAYVTRVQ